MGVTSATNYALLPAGKGRPNEGPWGTPLGVLETTAHEMVGVIRNDGPNKYMYVQFGTGAINSAGIPVKNVTGLTDTNGVIAPFQCTALGATAAGYFSCVGVTIQTATGQSGLRYGWICVEGIGTLPLNSNTAGLAFGIPIAPSSSSAGFAECAAGSSVGRVMEPTGVTLGTATVTANGGNVCRFSFYKSLV